MTPERKDYLERVLWQAESMATELYRLCNLKGIWDETPVPQRTPDNLISMRTAWHAYCEWVGVMREHVKVCREAWRRGEDFTQMDVHRDGTLHIEDFQLEYLNEKIGCMFNKSVRLVRVEPEPEQDERVAATDEDGGYEERPKRTFRLNGDQVTTEAQTLTYAQLVALARMQGDPSMTVVYTHTRQRSAIVYPGERIPVDEGMQVRINHTGNA